MQIGNDIELLCSACQNNKLNFFWSGNCRKGAINIKESTITNAYICFNCNTITTQQFNKYNIDNFKSGKYRLDVDGITKNIFKNYYYKHYESLLNTLKNIPKKNIYNKNILDFGSGNGQLLKILQPLINIGVGIEIDKQFYFKNKNIINLSNFKKADKIVNKYDLIISSSVFGQLHDPQIILSELSKRLKNNGLLIISDINSNDDLLKFGTKLYKDEIFFRQSYQNYFSEQGLRILAKKFNLNNYSTIYKQRYDFANYSKFLSKKKLSLKMKLFKKNKITSDFFKKYQELNKVSDYMTMYFKFKK